MTNGAVLMPIQRWAKPSHGRYRVLSDISGLSLRRGLKDMRRSMVVRRELEAGIMMRRRKACSSLLASE